MPLPVPHHHSENHYKGRSIQVDKEIEIVDQSAVLMFERLKR